MSKVQCNLILDSLDISLKETLANIIVMSELIETLKNKLGPPFYFSFNNDAGEFNTGLYEGLLL